MQSPEKYNLFGKTEKIQDKEPGKGGRRYDRMQETFGKLEGKTCGSCEAFTRVHWRDRTYFKCALWHMSHCESTDIRKKDPACGKYKQK